MKKHEIIFSIIKIPFDFIIIFSSFFLAKKLREIENFIPILDLEIKIIENEFLWKFAFFWAILYIIVFSIHWLYLIKITSSKISEILDIIFYWIYWFLFFSVFVYFAKDFLYQVEIPRLIIIYTFIIWTTIVIIERILLNKIQKILIEKWIIEKRKILLITNQNEKKIKNIINDIEKTFIYEIVWYSNKDEVSDSKIKYLWNFKNLSEIIKERKIDEILFIDSNFSKKELYDIWDLTRIKWIRYRYITNWFDVTKTNTTFSLLNNIPVVEIKTTPLDSWWRVGKRLFDLVFSIFLLIILIPFFFLIWILIKIEDPKWPIIYKNKRVWQNWKIFNLYKFRYLKWEYCIKDSYWVDNDNDEALKYENELIKKMSTRKWPLYKIKDDPRKTKIWTFIEKFSIDELPQLINVIIWNMSLVWPRPHQPREVKKYKLEQKRVLTIKPWITWLAQVNWRDKNKFEDEIKLDIFYIENWSFILDLKIILKTIWVVLNRK